MGCKCGKEVNENEKQFDDNNQSTEHNYENGLTKKNLLSSGFKLYNHKTNNLDLQYMTRNLSFSLYELINKTRTNPKSFIDTIKIWKEKIIYKNNQYLLPISNEIYISLNKGVNAFDECITYLNQLEPMNSLIMKEELSINIEENIKENYEESNYTSFSFLEKVIKIKKKELEKNNKKYKISGFHYDKSCDNPECSLVLQIVDDNMGDLSRRKNLLNPYFTYIGITTVIIKENVFCYYCLFANKN
jgi:hypothetical protein